MNRRTQKEQLDDLVKRPIPRKRVGIVHLEMVKESRCLYGMRRFSTPEEAVEMVKPLFERADREMVIVLSLNTKLEPQAVEVAAVGGLNQCFIDVKNIFKHALLNNAAYIICLHNHISGNPEPSREDRLVTERLIRAGSILGINLIDHIITGDNGFYSFREDGNVVFTQDMDAA